MRGTPTITFIDLVRDTIRTHGLRWAIAYYAKRMPMWEVRFFVTQAYLGA